MLTQKLGSDVEAIAAVENVVDTIAWYTKATALPLPGLV